MKKIYILLLSMVSIAFAFSQTCPSFSDVIVFISNNDYRQCFSLTNDIDIIMAASTGNVERLNCKLLKASILLDHAENMASENSFVSATNLCCEIESELSGEIAWQRVAALCKFNNAMFEDGHPEIAFCASTNLLAAFQGAQCTEADTNVWNALFRAGGLDIMSPADFIRANAAAAQFRIDSSLDLSEYTNGLPQEIVREIRRE